MPLTDINEKTINPRKSVLCDAYKKVYLKQGGCRLFKRRRRFHRPPPENFFKTPEFYGILYISLLFSPKPTVIGGYLFLKIYSN